MKESRLIKRNSPNDELIDGRNISKQTPEEVQKLLKRDVRSLSPEEMEVMQLIMAEMTGGKTGLLELMNELRVPRTHGRYRNMADRSVPLRKSA